MKASESQKKMCDFIISTVTFWKDNNDIGSPTNECDIYNEVESLNIEESEELKDKLVGLLNFIRHQ